ncbi:hypothetical protein CB0940_10932 [Cercospora beticola]|uniref:F-box domain-containing protein n=1 Tax=Cercospora beticola TaxID=122368 RepID=A0A2G5HDV1_CERBT|nr:hypothetical protein CB0940_10932 [Cercospora beticola]PIA90412.1 hypothetical protein CB0940_10932 [Cercospora beticola]WPB07726.1 hypothetical protein RHO25_012388 [Cercospora beticola]
MDDTTTFVPTDDDDYSHFDDGSVEWKACRERDRLAAIALDEMFDAQKQGGETWLAWLEKHRGREVRAEVETKRRLCQEEQDRYCQWKDWISLQRELQDKEYCAIPVDFRTPLKQWELEWNQLSWQAEEAYRQRCNDIWSGKYRGEGGETVQGNEAADDTVLKPLELAESSESTETLPNDSVVELPKLDLPDSSPPLDDQSDEGANADQANEAADDTLPEPERLTESSDSPKALRNDSVVELPKLDQSDLSPFIDDQSNTEFPSLPSPAVTPNDKSDSPHPKSLYRTPNPIILVSPPLPAERTISKGETSTIQTARQLQPASYTAAHRGRDDLAGPRTMVQKKRPAAKSLKAAKQQIKEISTLGATAQVDTPEKKQEKVKQPVKKDYTDPPQPVSTPKKPKKPMTDVVATPAPVVVSGPISGRKRKVKSFTSSQKPPAPQLSVQASSSGAASAATPTCPALAPETEAEKTKVDVSGAMEQSERVEVAAERNVAGEGSGEMWQVIMAPKRKAEEDIDYSQRPLCKHRCNRKDTCGHGGCCREHVRRAAAALNAQPTQDPGEADAPEPATAAREPEEARTQSPDNTNAGGQQTSEQEIAATAPEAQPAQSPENANGGGEQQAIDGDSTDEQAEANGPNAAPAPEDSSLRFSVQINNTGPLERPSPMRDQSNHPEYALNMQSYAQSRSVTPGNYRTPQRYLCNISGCKEVLRLTELRDEILLYLPPQDLLRYRRVCKEWKNTIDYVPRPVYGAQARQPKSLFKRAMFLEADDEYLPPRPIHQRDIDRTMKFMRKDFEAVREEVPYVERATHLSETMGIDLRKPEDIPWLNKFNNFAQRAVDADIEALIKQTTPPRVAINPALFRLEGRPTVTKRRDNKNSTDPNRPLAKFRGRRAHFLVNPMIELDATDKRLNMFITQPPTKKVALRWELNRMLFPTREFPMDFEQVEGSTWEGGLAGSERYIEREQGIRYRDVIRLVELAAESSPWAWEEEQEEISPWHTDLFRTYILTDPEVDVSYSQCWGTRLPRDGSDFEPEWLYSWNLFRRNDRNWGHYLRYHWVMKFGEDPQYPGGKTDNQNDRKNDMSRDDYRKLQRLRDKRGTDRPHVYRPEWLEWLERWGGDNKDPGPGDRRSRSSEYTFYRLHLELEIPDQDARLEREFWEERKLAYDEDVSDDEVDEEYGGTEWKRR